MKFKTLGVGALVLAGLFAAALPSQAQQQRKLTVWWVKGFYKAEDDALFEAIKKFDQCLELDPLNLTYNATILLNKAIALNKKGKNDEALTCLNKCLKMNPEYAKAYVKRGEVH